MRWLRLRWFVRKSVLTSDSAIQYPILSGRFARSLHRARKLHGEIPIESAV